MKVYTALNKNLYLEEDGYIWQHDIPDEFKCECGQTNYSLRYVKEGLHGLLLKRLSPSTVGASYIRRYAHEQIIKIIDRFNSLLETKHDEKTFQEYIEKQTIMLSRFHARRLFIKPRILDKFVADFAVLDSRNQLLLIEIESPSLLLFTKKGYPTAKLTHAYGQVRDWLHEYEKYPDAVLASLDLTPDQVVAVRGVVIAGRSSPAIFKHLQRHLSKPLYPEIEFLTFDDLSISLQEISRRLA